MKKLAFTSILIAAFALSLGQDDIKLGSAKPVDIHVLDVEWQPAGKAFTYRRTEENGMGIGVYAIGNHEGKVVIPIGKTDTWSTYWLANSNSALLSILSEVPEAKAKSTQVRIYLVDADKSKATQLFAQTYENKFLPSVEINTSPSLRHAIVTFQNSVGKSHKVLPLGGAALVDSADLDRAAREGITGPNWSIDGTAIYSNISGGVFRSVGGESITLATTAAKGDGSTAAAATTEAFTINVTAIKLDGSSTPEVRLSGLKFKLTPPMPPTGSSVLELMTGTPVLRPVRFRGPWVGTKPIGPMMTTQNQSLVLKFDQSNAQDTSVWLTRGTAKGTPATLVAVHADNTWMPQSKNGIAYVIDGALFFRSIGN